MSGFPRRAELHFLVEDFEKSDLMSNTQDKEIWVVNVHCPSNEDAFLHSCFIPVRTFKQTALTQWHLARMRTLYVEKRKALKILKLLRRCCGCGVGDDPCWPEIFPLPKGNSVALKSRMRAKNPKFREEEVHGNTAI